MKKNKQEQIAEIRKVIETLGLKPEDLFTENELDERAAEAGMFDDEYYALENYYPKKEVTQMDKLKEALRKSFLNIKEIEILKTKPTGYEWAGAGGITLNNKSLLISFGVHKTTGERLFSVEGIGFVKANPLAI